MISTLTNGSPDFRYLYTADDEGLVVQRAVLDHEPSPLETLPPAIARFGSPGSVDGVAWKDDPLETFSSFQTGSRSRSLGFRAAGILPVSRPGESRP